MLDSEDILAPYPGQGRVLNSGRVPVQLRWGSHGLVAAVSDIENEGSALTAGIDSHSPDDQCDHAFAGGASSAAPNITVTLPEKCAVG